MLYLPKDGHTHPSTNRARRTTLTTTARAINVVRDVVCSYFYGRRTVKNEHCSMHGHFRCPTYVVEIQIDRVR